MKSLAIPPPIHHFIDVLFGQAQLGRPDPKVDALQFDADTSSEVFGVGPNVVIFVCTFNPPPGKSAIWWFTNTLYVLINC